MARFSSTRLAVQPGIRLLGRFLPLARKQRIEIRITADTSALDEALRRAATRRRPNA